MCNRKLAQEWRRYGIAIDDNVRRFEDMFWCGIEDSEGVRFDIHGHRSGVATLLLKVEDDGTCFARCGTDYWYPQGRLVEVAC